MRPVMTRQVAAGGEHNGHTPNMSETEPNRVHPDEIEDEQTLRQLRRATESDALTVEIDGEETELVKSAGDEEIRKAVERTKDRKPDDPGRDRITALAKAEDKHPAKVAAELGVDPDPYRDREDLAKAYARNPLKNRAEPLEKRKAEAYDVSSGDDSDEVERAKERKTERVLLVERGWHPGY